MDALCLERMRDTLYHRGPDESGVYVFGHIGLAMRRLSIIDLTTGTQPMGNEDGLIQVVHNGEIYNYKDLRSELLRQGHQFRTTSDTEVIVHAYEEYGDACVERFHGMFAFALWDERKQRLLLARDRLGIKPLFFAETEDGLVFGSEIKAILASGYPRELDLVALDEYLSHFYVPAPHSIFKGIYRLLPGHFIVCELGHREDREYWDLRYEPEPACSEEEYCDELRDILRRAVQRHLQSDVPLGVFLSGGLDSSTVVAFMSQLVGEPIRTFTIGFREASYDERAEARQVANVFGTLHTERVVEPDIVEIAPRLVTYFDEPFGDYSAMPTYFVSQLAREHVKVVLSGDGGDELFAGYQTHYAHKVSRLYQRVPKVVRDNLIRPVVERLPTSMERISFDYMAKRFVAGADLPFQRGHFWWKVIFSETDKKVLYSADLARRLDGANYGYEVFDRYFRRVQHLDPLSQLLYVDAKTFLLDDNLCKVDRMSMANSLEVRVPLLDTELIEFMRRVPPALKLRGFRTKSLLRETMRGMLPRSIIRGSKKGFTPPLPIWIRDQGRSFVKDTIENSEFLASGLLQPEFVSSCLDQHFRGVKDNNRQIWTLLSLSLWLDHYKPSVT